VTIKKLYLEQYGNIVTKEGGDSWHHDFTIKGASLSGSQEAINNTNELIKRWNEYDANQQEIAELKEFKTGLLRCVKSQREEIKKLQTGNDNAALRVASLGGEAVRQVKMFNEQVDEIAELKSKLASAKVDAINEAAEWIGPETAAGEEACDLLRQYATKREGE